MSVQADYRRVMDVFDEVCDLPGDAQADAINRLCAGDDVLRGAVERMLRHDRVSDGEIIEIEIGAGAQMLAADLASDGKAAAKVRSPDETPALIGQYRVIRKIGEGGMGVVYLAQQHKPQRTVALKVIRGTPGASPAALRRFEHEAHILGLLAHPGIAQIFEAGTAEPIMSDGSRGPSGGAPGSGGAPFFAMEFVDGSPITTFATDHKLNVRQRLELMMKVCLAVEHAHAKGVIHRDLKPSNILVVEGGSRESGHQSIEVGSDSSFTSPQPKILDFGVARLTDSDRQITTIQTEVGQLVGTLQYMSPEQVSGDVSSLDTRSDVYALGVILHELIAGKPPHDLRNKSVPEAMRIIRDEEPSRLSAVDRTFRGRSSAGSAGSDVETIVLKALEKDKTRRYQSAAELAEDIRRHLANEPIIARPASAMYTFRKFAQRHKLAVGAVVAVIAALVVGVIGTTLGLIEATRQWDEALRNARIAQAVNDFVNDDLLAQASPSNEPDRNITLRAVLDRAEATIDSRFPDDPSVQASIRTTLGRTYQALGEFEKAQPHLQQALELNRGHLGETDVHTLSAAMDLADVLRLRGEYESSERICRQVIGAATVHLGPEHDVTLNTRDVLATVLEKLNRYQEGEALVLETYEIRRRKYGENAGPTVDSMRLVGLMYERNGKFEQAEDMMARAIQAMVESKGPEHPDTLTAMNNLALVYFGQQRYEEAEQLLDRVYATSKRVLGERHNDTLVAMSNLAMMMMGQRRYDEAEPLMVEKLRIVQDVLGPTHSDTLNARNSLAGLYYRTKRHELEEPLLRQTLELARAAYGEKHLEAMVALASLARMQLSMKRYDEAQQNGEYAYALMSETLGDENPITQMMVTYLAQIAKAQDKPSEVERWQQKLKQQ